MGQFPDLIPIVIMRHLSEIFDGTRLDEAVAEDMG